LTILERLRANWPFKAMSVVVALLLWVYVLGAEDPEGERRVTCRVVPVNTPADLAVIGVTPETVDVKVRGRKQWLDRASLDDMHLIADLKGAEVDEQKVPLLLRGLPALVRVVPGYVASAVVTLDKVVERVGAVVVQQKGQPTVGYMVTGIAADPEEVTLRGAVSVVHRVARVVAVVDISGLNSTTTVEAAVEARDHRDVPVTGLHFKPEQVKVTVTVKRVNSKTVPVRPQVGDPAAGWQVAEVQTSPPVATVTAPGDLLARVTSIPTVRIDISGLRGTKTYLVLLSAPERVSVLGGGSVRVTVTVRRSRTPAGPEEPAEESPSGVEPSEEESPPDEAGEEPGPGPEETVAPPGGEEPGGPTEGGGGDTQPPRGPAGGDTG
jgi:YbbR domain-containing protein